MQSLKAIVIKKKNNSDEEGTRLAQVVEHATLDLSVVSSSPTLGPCGVYTNE